MNFLFFFLSQQASNGINGRGERNGRDVTQVGSEFFFQKWNIQEQAAVFGWIEWFFLFFSCLMRAIKTKGEKGRMERCNNDEAIKQPVVGSVIFMALSCSTTSNGRHFYRQRWSLQLFLVHFWLRFPRWVCVSVTVAPSCNHWIEEFQQQKKKCRNNSLCL